MAKKYSQKLKDPRWQKKRLEVFERDNWKCTICQDETETLNVHHKSYKGEPWDVELSELTTLCESCHTFISAYFIDDITNVRCIITTQGKYHIYMVEDVVCLYLNDGHLLSFSYDFLSRMFSLLTDKININGKEND